MCIFTRQNTNLHLNTSYLFYAAFLNQTVNFKADADNLKTGNKENTGVIVSP